jgi:uncharacterized protein YkwD
MSRAVALLLAAALTAAAADDTKIDPKKDDKGAQKLTPQEQQVLELTNAERKKAELPPLKANARLTEAARQHGANMAKQNKLEHVLDDKTPSDRAEAAGYKIALVGENIAWNQKTPKDVVTGWMNSKPHRENILDPEYTEVGVAVVRNAKGEPYWVQVFGKPQE